MINLDKVKNIYISHEYTDMRKQVDGLSIMIQTVLKLDPFEKSLFVFCNKGKNRLKILHFNNGLWLYYHRLEKGKFKWPDKEGLFNISFEELKWFINILFIYI